MGYLDRILGRKEKDKPSESEPTSSSSATSELLTDTAPSTSASSFSTTPTLNSPSLGGMPNVGGPPTLQGIDATTLSLPNLDQSSGRLYDPYEGISSAIVGKKHAAFKLPEQPEFVFEEEAAVRRRGWTENLQFYTGLGYLSGGAIGLGAGGYYYLTSTPEIPLDTVKLKANRILNAVGSRAKPLSNSFGILGLFFASIESYMVSNVDIPELPEGANSVLAGALSGALFRSPRGPRQAAAAAAVGAVGGASVAVLRTIFPSL